MNTSDLLILLREMDWVEVSHDEALGIRKFSKSESALTITVDYLNTYLTATYGSNVWRDLDYTRSYPARIKEILVN